MLVAGTSWAFSAVSVVLSEDSRIMKYFVSNMENISPHLHVRGQRVRSVGHDHVGAAGAGGGAEGGGRQQDYLVNNESFKDIF